MPASEPVARLPAGPREKGPLVFLDYDQAELDAAYDQAAYAPHSEHVRRRLVKLSEAARSRLGPPRRVEYGPTEIEKLDIYVTQRANAPVHIHLHGGAWRRGSAKGNAYAAEVFVNAGAHFVVPDFVWVQDAEDSLRTLADQVKRALIWVYRNARSFGGDPERVYISGMSSGAHLAAVLLTMDWRADGLPADVLKGGLCCSGMYDLRPVRLSARSLYVPFDDAMEDALSPQRHIDRLLAPLIVAFGTLETPEFKRQARDFAQAVHAAGKEVTLIACDEYNHFEIKEALASPYAALGRAALAQMRLGA